MNDRDNGTTNSEDIFLAVRGIIVDSLGVSEDMVQPELRLVADLGAESIDFLDIAFRLEEETGVHLPMKEWTKASEEDHELTPERLAQRLWRVFRVEVSDGEAAGLLANGLDGLASTLERRYGLRLIPHELARLRAAVDPHLGVKEFAARQIDLFTVQSLVNFVCAARASGGLIAQDRGRLTAGGD